MIGDIPAAGTTSCLYEPPVPGEPANEEMFRPGGLALTDQALALCALPPGARVLDVGCGAGATVAHLVAHYGLAAYGLDRLPAPPRGGRSLPLVQSLGEHLPVGQGQLDAIIAECALSVMADAGPVLSEFRRVLKAGGLLILSDIYLRHPDGRSLPAEICLGGAVSQAQIFERLHAHGFWVTGWQDHSAALKQFAVHLIFSNGSLPQFWRQTVAPSGARAAGGKLGYYLLLAQKGEA